jgi:hypothetical protein
MESDLIILLFQLKKYASGCTGTLTMENKKNVLEKSVSVIKNQ